MSFYWGIFQGEKKSVSKCVIERQPIKLFRAA